MDYKSFPVVSFKIDAASEPQGIFEALVSVFGNVDLGGDRVMPGAFAGTLERWKESGNPLPVLFAHQWNDLDSHIGEVLEAEETEEGLRVKAQLEMDEPFAARVWKKLKRRLIRQFSFSYDIIKEKMVDGVRELHELELFEVGPCFQGMNPATQLLDAKGLKPYANEHSCRLRDPGDFEEDSFRRVTREHEGKKYDVIMGRLEGETSMTEQAYRYPTKGWEEADARAHCREHEGEFHAATGKGQKRGARHTAKEYETIQSIHELAVELGARCSEQSESVDSDDSGAEAEGEDQDEAGDGKSRNPGRETLAARIAIELMEAGIDD